MYIIKSKVSPIKYKTNNNKHANFIVCYYKKKWNLTQNSPAVIKCAAAKIAVVKRCKIPRNSCDGRLNNNLGEFSAKSEWNMEKATQIHLNCCYLTFSLPLQPCLGCHFGFHIFFHNSNFEGRTLFYSWAVLG